MTLRKWRSSHPEVLNTIPINLQEPTMLDICTSPSGHAKALGLHWDTGQDAFYVSIPDLSTSSIATKRTIASTVARCFDVMGWFSPALLPAKLLIQEAWIQQFPWDDPLPDHLQQCWSAWLQDAPALQSHPVNRFCTSPGINVQHRTLCGFSDASSNAYGGAVYLRTMNTDTSTTVELLTSKSKLAPIKKQTIPRLELCGAHLLSKLLQQTAKDQGIPLESTYAWCDSAVVLGWLKTSPGRLKTCITSSPRHCQSNTVLKLEICEYSP